MPHEYTDEQLDRAFQQVSVIKVAQHFGIALKAGVQKSPFRNDQHGASFSVYTAKDGSSRFKDHADPDFRGGVWKMAQLCAPGMPGKEIRDLLVTLNGDIPKRLTRGQVKREVTEKRGELYRIAAEKASELPKLDGAEPPEWDSKIYERWAQGTDALVEQADEFGTERGWCKATMCELIDQDKTSAPLLPWADSGDRRGWAWKVEKPVYMAGRMSLVPVGYHERYFVYERGVEAQRHKERRWCYVPSVPKTDDVGQKTENRMSEFQKHLRGLNVRIPAYPFVLGDFESPARLCVILEGQFDAVSFALAFGWLLYGFPAGVTVFGLRGVQSQTALLAGYGQWLRKHRPFVWVIGDNDAAGRKIDQRDNRSDIVREPSFIDRLRGQGCKVYAELINHPGCKDFNDVWRLAKPSAHTMIQWAKHVGAGDLVQ